VALAQLGGIKLEPVAMAKPCLGLEYLHHMEHLDQHLADILLEVAVVVTRRRGLPTVVRAARAAEVVAAQLIQEQVVL
jgi:hypothetical protein